MIMPKRRKTPKWPAPPIDPVPVRKVPALLRERGWTVLRPGLWTTTKRGLKLHTRQGLLLSEAASIEAIDFFKPETTPRPMAVPPKTKPLIHGVFLATPFSVLGGERSSPPAAHEELRKTPERLVASGEGWKMFEDPKFAGGYRLDVKTNPILPEESYSIGAAHDTIAKLSAALAAIDLNEILTLARMHATMVRMHGVVLRRRPEPR
jgi:hypothetical protein